MSFTFYRKYRPQKFSDVIGQEAVVKTLENSLATNRVSHAYLFTGPRGTGKTTLARLFAKAVNCLNRKEGEFEPCGTCAACTLQEEGRSLDVIEIDAASHTGVDNIRELKETVTLPPTVGTHKVYIIDEAHMLSLGAWNALLKTLEEPPAHVIFIMATTNAQKVPETILSRALRFDLSRFPVDSIVDKLTKIAKAEKIKIDKPALVLIARAAQGGMRDAEALFTQIASLEESPIEEERVAILLGVTNSAALAQFLGYIADNDLSGGIRFLQTLKEKGLNLSQFSLSLLQYLRKALLASLDQKASETMTTDLTVEEKKELVDLATRLGSERIVACLERFQEAEYQGKSSPLPELPLEIALAKLVVLEKNSTSPTPPSSPTQTSSLPEKKEVPPVKPAAPVKKASVVKKSLAREVSSEESTPKKNLPPLDLQLVFERWGALLNCVRDLNASAGVALTTAYPREVRENVLILKVKYPFHKDRLQEKQYRLTIDTAFATILGFQVLWKVELETKKDAAAETPQEHSPLIDQALELLGGRLAPEN